MTDFPNQYLFHTQKTHGNGQVMIRLFEDSKDPTDLPGQWKQLFGRISVN